MLLILRASLRRPMVGTMRYFRYLILLPWLAGSPSLASAKSAPMVLAPASSWNAYYAEDYCRLSRSFGSDKQQIALVIDRFAPGDSFRLMLAGQPMALVAPKGTANIRFGPALPEQRLDFLSGTVGKDIPAWVFGQSNRIRPDDVAETERKKQEDYTLAPITDAEVATITEIAIGRPLRNPVVLATGPMAAALAALDACTDELLTHWGIDVARHKEISRPVAPVDSPANWLKSSDYPREMLAKLQPGLVQVRLIVGADGIPTACHIQQSTDAKGFDDAVCGGMMRRARFDPALDKDGKPIMSYYVNLVRFQPSGS